MSRRRVLILGAAGRDFHNFNVVFRDDPDSEVVGFTATQMPKIDGRRYPASLAGKLYPEGLPLYPEADLRRLIGALPGDEAVFPTSANLTEAALARNVERGMLVRGRALALAGARHFRALIDRELLKPLPGE